MALPSAIPQTSAHLVGSEATAYNNHVHRSSRGFQNWPNSGVNSIRRARKHHGIRYHQRRSRTTAEDEP